MRHFPRLTLRRRRRERKNCNLPGVIVDLPTITEKDQDDLLNWAIPNQVDFIGGATHPRRGNSLRQPLSS